MAGSRLGGLVLLVSVFGGLWQYHFKYILDSVGLLGREIVALNNDACEPIPGLDACEKIILYEPTGYIFAACSTPLSRTVWTPALKKLDVDARARDDFLMVYDPSTRSGRKIAMNGFTDPRGYNAHGMDVVPSSTHPGELWVYLVNQRPKSKEGKGAGLGTDPSVEVFRMRSIEAKEMEHVATVNSPLMQSPNDVVGSTDGTHFWFTNDGSHLTGFASHAELYLRRPSTSVGFCRVRQECKIVVTGLQDANGIARSKIDENEFYVMSDTFPELRILQRQADESMVVKRLIHTGLSGDNVAVDEHGDLWISAMPLVADRVARHFKDPEIVSPSTVLHVTLNKTTKAGASEPSFCVQKVFEDSGEVSSGMTTALYDWKRERLFQSALAAPTVMCKIPRSNMETAIAC